MNLEPGLLINLHNNNLRKKKGQAYSNKNTVHIDNNVDQGGTQLGPCRDTVTFMECSFSY